MDKLALTMDLTLFGDDAGAGGEMASGSNAAGQDAGGAADTAAETANQGVNAVPHREGRRDNIFPRVPKAEVTPARPRAEMPRQYPAAQTQQPAETWEDVKKRYKDQYGADVRAAVQERFKNHEDQSQKLNAAMNTLAAIAPYYGINPDANGGMDMDKLSQAILNDRHWYEKKALENGIPVEQQMHVDQLEIEKARREREDRQSLEKEMIKKHFDSLQEQGAELQKEFPGFDLMAELQSNDAFARMTAPGGGMTVRQAYFALHGDEIMQRQTRAASEYTKQTMSRAIQSGGTRPQENGMAAAGGGIPARDYSRMTRQEWAELRRRAQRGEKIQIT